MPGEKGHHALILNKSICKVKRFLINFDSKAPVKITEQAEY